MNGKFIQSLLSIVLSFFIGFLINPINSNAQNCANPTGTSASNISNFTATINWTMDSSVDHYKMQYRKAGSSNWMSRNNIMTNSKDINNLDSASTYVFRVMSFCSSGSSSISGWSVIDTFVTANFVVDCYNTPDGTAFLDSCGNCVGGTTNKVACIPFSPSVSISLSSLECNSLSDITFIVSQDANEPDMSSTVFSSDGGSFNFTGLVPNDIIGSSVIVAGGGYINVNTTLKVGFIITPDKISVNSVDDVTGQVYGSFTIENAGGGILVVATSAPDNNNVTSGNSQIILLNGLFVNPTPSALTFTSTINSELGDVDVQGSTTDIECLDCDGVLGGSAIIDSCGNCVGGNTGNVACISFSPTVSVLLSNTNCDSLSDLTINVSQDANEPDMSTSLFSSNLGSFDISNMNIGNVIGSATMVAGSGVNTFNTILIVTNIISSNQAIIQSQDVLTGLVLGTFTISNSNPGVNITAQSIPDNNNVTSGNSQSITFSNVFVNPGQSTLTFTSTINSELGDINTQDFPFNIVCLCVANTSSTTVISCDAYTWNGTTYTSSGSYDYVTVNSNGCDSTATLNLTINGSTTSTINVTTCGGYMFNGSVYFQSGAYTYTTTNVSGCDSTVTLNLTINNATSSNIGVTECDSYIWNGTTYTSSGVYSFHTTNAAGCDSTATLALVIFNSTTSTIDVTIPNTYTWNGTTYTSSGVYTWLGTNAAGCDSTATLNLTILTCDVPLNPVTHTILLDRATLSWDAVSGVHHYQIRFKEVSGSSWLVLDNYLTSRTKTGLTAGNDYHWQVRTLCDLSGSSSSAWSDTISFSTPVICTLPVSTTNITIGLDFASFSWDSVNGVSEYIVRVKEVSGAWATWAYDTVTANTYTSYGLNNSTNYHWQVRAACAPLGANNSGFTTYTNFTTLTPCIDPSLLTIDSVGVNEAYLSWTAPAGTDHFVVLYSELGTGVWSSASTTTSSIFLTGLATYSAYEWSVLAFCEATGLNNSDTIVGVNFSTANPCTAPTGLVTSNILLDRITINWNTVALAHHYEVRVREQGTSTWTNIINLYGNSRTKTGLSTATTYEWEIRSICTSNGSSFSDWSATQTATTLSPCLSVTNETTTNIALTTATLTWDASPGVYAYRLRFKESSAAWSAWQYDTILAPNNSINKSGLTAGTDYHWQVQVICESSGLNNSGFTSYQNFTTIALCSNPHSLSVTQITLNSAKLIMYGPNNPDHYYVLYKAVTASVWDTVILSGVDINGGYASKVVTGLSSAITYEWKSQSSCQADDSNISAFVSGPNFTTITPCAIPSNLSASVTGQDAIFTWDAVAGAAFYTVKYRVLNGNWQTVTNLNSPTYTATNLGFGFSFEWIASSHCDWINMNYSIFSPADTFSTASCPTPQNIAVSNILTDRATISWNFNTSVHHYAVRARVSGTTIWTRNISHIYTGNRTITGLSDGITYEFQIRSACTNDTSNVSSWTAMQTFTTLANCNAKPTSATTTNITLTSADLSFIGTANAVTYLVRFKEASAAWGAWVYDTLSAPAVSVNKVGLTAGTYYHWQAKAICDLAGTNSSAWTSYETFTTNQPCSDPFNLMVQNIYVTPVSASVRWNGQMNISYLVMFKDTSVSNWDTLSITSGVVTSVTTLPVGVSATSLSSGSVTDLAIDGLTPETAYEWQVVSECSSYNASAAVVGPLFTTLPPCTTPSALSTTAISATTATVNWGATVTAHHYALRGRIQGSSVWAFDIAHQNNTSRTIHNLTAGQTYEWQVRSVCSNDTSEVSAWSSLQVFSTLVSCDNPPSNLNETNIDLSTATLNWDVQPNTQAYEVRFRETSQAWSTLVYTTLTGTTLNKHGLSSGTAYHWQVRAICDTINNIVSQWTPWGSFNTTIPCALPSNLKVLNSQTTLTSASLRWYGPMNIDYYVMFKETGATNMDTVIVHGTTVTNVTLLPFGVNVTASTAGSESNVTIAGLSSTTTYEWQIISACTGLNLSSSVLGTNFTTLTGCAIPSNLTSSVLTSTAIISWDAVPGAVKYDVRKMELGGSSWGYINNLTSITRTMHGLTPGATYIWEVRSHCDMNNGNISAWSSTEQFTMQVVCTKPTNPVANNIAGTTADLQWDAIPAGSWGYRVMYLKQGAAWGTKVVDTVSTNIYNAIALDVNTTYRWRVQGICDQTGLNNSNFTSFKYFTTLSSNRVTAGDAELGDNLNVYPNPTKGIFNISFVSEELDNFEISIIDAFGKIVSREDKQNFIGEFTKKVDLSDYPRGIYMVQIKTNASFVSKRIVLQ
jgi:hypothetical protein